MKRYSTVLLLALALILLAPSIALADAPTRYDNYTTDDDSDAETYLNIWLAQTFTTTDAFELDKIRLKVFKEGTPGTLTVSIRTVNATDAPNGADLASGTLADTYVTTGASWYDIDFDNVGLAANTTYAIVMRSTGTSDSVNFHVRIDGSSGAYAGGSEWTSTDGGYTWAADADDDYVFELWGYPVVQAHNAAVFNSYYADGDWLIVASYTNVYEPYYPSTDPRSHFVVQLLNGATVLAQTNLSQWGYKPIGIYLSADAVTSLTWGAAYTVRIIGLDEPYVTADYTLTAADWKGSDLGVLDSWCIATARGMEDYYDATFVVLVSEKGEVLNEEGGVIFDTGIPGLATVRGEYLFQIAASGIPYTEGTWTSAYGGTLDPWYVQLGPDISTLVNDTADLIDTDGDTVLLLGLLALYMTIAIIMVAHGLNAGAFAVLSPMLMFGYMLRILPWAALGVAIAILVMMAVRQLWWKST